MHGRRNFLRFIKYKICNRLRECDFRRQASNNLEIWAVLDFVLILHLRSILVISNENKFLYWPYFKILIFKISSSLEAFEKSVRKKMSIPPFKLYVIFRCN